ncbi:glucosamine-6-phosphate deaminase [Brevibacillus laterosporus]|uniref:Glucosamine-6-phosphate deaminase n=1 Tax=Brevibacillus laterosporus TaxID=1465 RepID=A0A502ISU3_BRELA|nr:glucosamine-6-phosphate deaminase [Brevibacillus laterosporus]QDX91229.1 glucosamine-6-phosphate deaminase [Brevibacillus laterosporus]TPG88280.1 glucosamine-6-phosphate deaminase [Brevibacillus laterosporus]
MRVIVSENYQELSKKAAEIMAEQLKQKPTSVLGLATGSTPIGMYKELISMYQAGNIDFSKISTFNLDEYVGLTADHDQSYSYFMWDNLFSHVDIKKEQTNIPSGMFSDAKVECTRYEKAMKEAGGIDIQILGIGHNGHIGFNEPDQAFTLSTHVVELAPETIEANARFFNNKSEVPKQAVTMGIGGIMKARHVLLIVNDKSKAEAVRHLFTGTVDPQVPVSILQLHPNLTLLVDRATADLLPLQTESRKAVLQG